MYPNGNYNMMKNLIVNVIRKNPKIGIDNPQNVKITKMCKCFNECFAIRKERLQNSIILVIYYIIIVYNENLLYMLL